MTAPGRLRPHVAAADVLQGHPSAGSVGRKLTFRAAGNGTLQLGANDVAGLCSQDNRGSMTVQVTVTHRP
ncbi:hypothetical protein ACWD4O_24620 [Streptomyces sp. NPDC002623]